MKILKNVSAIFGKQIRKYRVAAKLSQTEYADYQSQTQSYITALELGKRELQIDTMQKHATAFGVNYFQLGNPDYPVPTLDQMPSAIRRASAKAAKTREEADAKKQANKEAGEAVYTTGTAAELHALIEEGFFKEPRTSREVYLELHREIKDGKLSDMQQKEAIKITGTLSKGKFAKLLDKLEPAPGSNAVRFVVKEKLES